MKPGTAIRHVAQWTAIGFVVFVALVLGASKIVHSTWNHERAGASISRWSSRDIAGRGPSHQGFTFGRVDYPWLPALRSLFFGPPVPFDAWEITIWDPDGKEVLYAPHVHAGLRLDRLVWAQLRGYLPWQKGDVELHFVEAKIDMVRCHIRGARGGRVNLVAAFAARVVRPPTGGGMVISVDGLTVSDGNYRMDFSGGPGWKGQLSHFEMRLDRLRYSSFPAEQEANRPAFTYHVSRIVAPRGLVNIGEYEFPLDHIVVTEFAADNPARQDIVIKALAGSLGADVAANGRLTDTYSRHAGVDLHLDARHGGRVIALFPTRKSVTGDVSVSAHLLGPFSSVVIDGAAHGAEVHIAPFEAQHAAARYRLAAGTLRIHDITSDVGGGHVTGEVTMEFRARLWRANLYLENIKSIPARLVPMEIIAYIVGRFQRLARMHATADETEHVTVHGVDITLFRRPRDNLPHRVVLAGKL